MNKVREGGNEIGWEREWECGEGDRELEGKG